MVNWVTIKKFGELTGYTEHAVRTKQRDGVWIEGKQWIKAPDGRVLISLEGYGLWVESGEASNQQAPAASKSASNIKGAGVGNASNLSPPPLT
ncbi:MAG: excisionase [Candidatus Thiodiazotropha sp.]